MKIYVLLHKIGLFLERFIITQLFLSLCTLPFLIWWGLPFSALTFLGNLFFSPFLTAYLICATVIFFTQLCGIPNAFFITILESLTSFWLMLLKQASPVFLYAAPRPSWIFLLIPPLCACILLTLKRSLTAKIYICALLISILGYFLLLHACTTTPQTYSLACGKSSITFTKENNTIHAYESETSAGKINPYQWITYTLCPTLAQQFGITKINQWHIPCLTPATSKRARILASYKLIDTLSVHATKISTKELHLFKKEMELFGCNVIFTKHKSPHLYGL